MAKATLHPTIEEFRGAIGEIVFKRVRGKIIATKKPVFSKDQEPSAGQRAQRQKFRDAAAYAKVAQADPALRAVYEPVARKREVAVYTVALRDHMNAPKIKSFYLWGYRGQPGEQIAIQAKDDFGLRELQVRLTTPDGTPVEGGPAVENGLHSGFWLYTTTVAAAPGSTLRVEVTGADYAGNRVRAAEEIVVGEERCVDVRASEPLPAAPVQAEVEEAVGDELTVPLPCAAETLEEAQHSAASFDEAPCLTYADAEAVPVLSEEEGEGERADERPTVAPALCQSAESVQEPAPEDAPAEIMPLALAPVPAGTLPVPVLWWALLAAVRIRPGGGAAAGGGVERCGLQAAGGGQDTPGALRHPEVLKKRALAPPEIKS